MTHAIAFNSETQMIEISVQGNLTLNEATEIISEATQVAREQGCFLILGDMREATSTVSILEIYSLPKIISEIYTASGLQSYKFKRAFVVANYSKEYQFFETVRYNRGQNTKIFLDMDEAKKWLLKK